MKLGRLLQSHPRESELIEAVLSRFPEELRGRVHIWAEASGRVHILPRGLKRSQWIILELGGYWRSEDWPKLPHWIIPSKKALGVLGSMLEVERG